MKSNPPTGSTPSADMPPTGSTLKDVLPTGRTPKNVPPTGKKSFPLGVALVVTGALFLILLYLTHSTANNLLLLLGLLLIILGIILHVRSFRSKQKY
ncbi:MAG: hypothetical protein K5764_01090 [Prevotella sp.]|nr:hypothetical protein [Prevotella sp.]